MSTAVVATNNASSLSRRALALLMVFVVAAPVLVNAGTTGAEFQPIFQLLTDWIGGYLGRTVALASLIIGVGSGAMAQRPIYALAGVLTAVFVLILPQVLNTMLTATI